MGVEWYKKDYNRKYVSSLDVCPKYFHRNMIYTFNKSLFKNENKLCIDLLNFVDKQCQILDTQSQIGTQSPKRCWKSNHWNSFKNCSVLMRSVGKKKVRRFLHATQVAPIFIA